MGRKLFEAYPLMLTVMMGHAHGSPIKIQSGLIWELSAGNVQTTTGHKQLDRRLQAIDPCPSLRISGQAGHLRSLGIYAL